MRVAVLFEDLTGRPEAGAAEASVSRAVAAVRSALEELGHTPLPIAIDVDAGAWISALAGAEADVVFNLCESLGGRASDEPRVAAAVELLGVPLTGTGCEALALARRKDHMNAILAAAGLPVPGWAVHGRGAPVRGWPWFPAIVKPLGEDGSVGVTQASVVDDEESLLLALDAGSRHGDLMVQEFVEGRELYVGFVGEEVLPVAEIDFGGLPPGARRLVTYDAKWRPGSPEEAGTRSVCPARLPAALRDRAIENARAAWRLAGGGGYGRVDLRTDAAGLLVIIEVNPNPDLDPSAGLARMAAAAGWGYAELIRRILDCANPAFAGGARE